MLKYSTLTSSLQEYLPKVPFTKEEVFLINFINLNSKNAEIDYSNTLKHRLHDALSGNFSSIISPDKISEIVKLSQKNYSLDTLKTMLKTYNLLYNKQEIIFDENFNLSENDKLVLLAQNYSLNNETLFWAPTDPFLAHYPILATIVENSETFEESQFNKITHTSPWSNFIIQKPIEISEEYPALNHYNFNIFEKSNLDNTDPLNIVFLLERTANINSNVDKNQKFSCINEWKDIFNVPSHLRNSFYDQFASFLGRNKNDKTVLKNTFYKKILESLSYETITHPEVISTLFSTLFENSFLVQNKDHQNPELLITDYELNEIITKHDLLNHPTFLEKSFASKFSPLYLLNFDIKRVSDNYNNTYSNSFYKNILEKIYTLKKSEQTYENLSAGENIQTQQFLKYFINFIQKFEEDINNKSKVGDLQTVLLNLKKREHELILWGLPFFSDDFKKKPAVLNYLSGVIFSIHKVSPFANNQLHEENHLLNAIISSYEIDDIIKHKKDLLFLSNGYFASNKNNQNSQSEYLNHIVEQCLVHEFSHIVNSQSLADNDIPFLLQNFSRFQKNKEEDISNFINFVHKYPELQKLGSIEFIQDMIPYFKDSIYKIKNKQLNEDSRQNLIELILNISNCFIQLVKHNQPDAFKENLFNITIDNFQEYKSLLASTAHFTMINSDIMSTLDINNEKHQQFVIDLVCKFNKNIATCIIDYPEVKPFFMLDALIKGLNGNTKFIEFEQNKLTLGKMYSTEDVKILFDRYGNQDYWFNFCPDTFLALAPIEYKQDYELWTRLFKKYESKIIPLIPLNLKHSPDFFIYLIKDHPENFNKVYNSFPKETLNSINVIQYVLSIAPSYMNVAYQELFAYIDKNSKDFKDRSYEERFQLLFTDKILEQAIPKNEIIKSPKIKKF